MPITLYPYSRVSSKQGAVQLRQATENIVASIDSVQPFVEFINPDIQNQVKSFNNHLNNFGTSQSQNKPTHLNNLNNTEDSTEIAEKLSNAESKLKELDRFYINVVGVTSDGEENSQGLKVQIENGQKHLDSLVERFDKKFTVLVNQVEDLLPGATSAGLATAYRELRTTAEDRTLRYSIAFFVLISVLTLTAAATVTQSFSILPPAWEAITFEDTSEYFTKLLFKLPVIAPVLWAALTVSKRRSEQHRLAEEYAHKEALAKSYEGFKKQIVELGKEDNTMLKELIAALLKAISLNAAKTLDGNHGEKMPVQEALEEAIKSTANQGGKP